MHDVFRYWHYKVAEAYAEGDMEVARVYCLHAAATPGFFEQDNLLDQVLRLALARHDDNHQWLAEAERVLAQFPASLDGSLGQETAVAGHVLSGLMKLGEPQAAAAHFSAALRLAPDFLPARVELELLGAAERRDGLFGALGADLPRQDWRYTLAASELGLIAAPSSAAQRVAAICIRGLCTPHTPALVRLYRSLNPAARIFLATWSATPAALVEELRTIAEVILVEDTDNPGVQNRNRQLLLARAVLAAAREAGFSHALLTRSDIALFQPDVLSQLLGLVRHFPVEPGRLLGRLVVPDIHTRRFMPFHVSDFMSFGTLPDLMLQWSAPLDVNALNVATEQYVHWTLHSTLGAASAEEELTAYRTFLRKYFIIRSFDWFGGVWTKEPALRNGDKLKLRDSCVSQSDWERLYYADDAATDLLGGKSLPNGIILQTALGIHKHG